MPPENRQWISGTDKAIEGAEDKTILAAPGADKLILLRSAHVTVNLVATGGGGLVALEDGVGGARIFEADADAFGHYNIDFGEQGYPLTANTILNLTVDGAATNQASATCTAVGVITG